MIISKVTVTYCEVLSYYVPVQKFPCTSYGRSFTLAGLQIDSGGRNYQKTIKCLNRMIL